MVWFLLRSQLKEFVHNFLQHQGVFFGPQDDQQQEMRRRFLARFADILEKEIMSKFLLCY